MWVVMWVVMWMVMWLVMRCVRNATMRLRHGSTVSVAALLRNR
jgi:hypothetical protein